MIFILIAIFLVFLYSLFFKKCDYCKRICFRKDMKHNITIGMHYPWSFCYKCYKDFFKNK